MAQNQTDTEMQQVLEKICSNFIALVCSVRGCDVAMVVPRYPEYDNPEATSIRQLCPIHEVEGDIPVYFDRDGNELSGDPELWSEKEPVRHA